MGVRKLKRRDGFTLIELLVAMGIGMIVLASVTTTFTTQAKFYNAQEQINEMEQNARGTLDIIARELKMAGYKATPGTVTWIGAAGVNLDNSNLIIEADLDGNGSIDNSSGSLERITYFYDSTNKQIRRRLGSATSEVLADNITAFTFSYLNSTGGAATLASQIRQVQLNITAKTDKPDPNYTSNNGYQVYQVTATITPPNLGY
jgi:type IV pilus assembly protein PilW